MCIRDRNWAVSKLFVGGQNRIHRYPSECGSWLKKRGSLCATKTLYISRLNNETTLVHMQRQDLKLEMQNLVHVWEAADCKPLLKLNLGLYKLTPLKLIVNWTRNERVKRAFPIHFSPSTIYGLLYTATTKLVTGSVINFWTVNSYRNSQWWFRLS